MERHLFAFGQILACGSLSSSQKAALTIAYQSPIRHGITNSPTANASAFVNRNWIYVNFGNQFPQGDREIAQSLIHEMMHCSGFTHPDRSQSDSPGDGGPYYSSPPLHRNCASLACKAILAAFQDPTDAKSHHRWCLRKRRNNFFQLNNTPSRSRRHCTAIEKR